MSWLVWGLWLWWASALAVEPWADARLTETNGLALWLDAGRQNAARGVAQLAPLQTWNDTVDYLFDGSGNARHLHQPLAARRPRFRPDISGAVLSFEADGRALGATGWKHAFSNATLFVVAAPKTVGGFRALCAFNRTGRNDYTSGLNLDFGSAGATQLGAVNAEGVGFSGEANLYSGDRKPLGRWSVFTLRAATGPKGVQLWLDGLARGQRDRAPGTQLSFDEFTLGGRHYSNEDARPSTRDFFEGELAEVLVFERALADRERERVEQYLQGKYRALLEGTSLASGSVLVTVTNPPPVHFMLPGFTSVRLPVELSNLNNVKYRPDGTLVAGGYDGRVWLLDDTDGDGVEERVRLFHDGRESFRSPIGLALTPSGYARGNGVFLATRDKVVLLVDTNRDDRADQEIVVATWTERSEQTGVGALGVAVGPDGSVYFSLGTASFTDGYVVDKASGQSRYPTYRDRGTIQRVSPDFSRRETVCTGIRFAVALEFNREGDLFCTEQEGATWLPNGNPFDELLHIQTGRHYGFPPRHPRWLPDVIDEPSVFDYRPQHQSTCGLNFNTFASSTGEAVFGSPLWAGDALVAGYSRGKVWRTQLVKTPAGYVAASQLLATLQSLVVDLCVSPRGDLLVATHSGKPDWGSGPNGPGQLWRMRRQPEVPLPLFAWSAHPGEIRVAYDRPLDPAGLRDLARRTQMEAGRYVFPGDRYETLWPGYQVVHDQRAAPRFSLPVLGASVSQDRSTLNLQIPRSDTGWNYAVTLPALGKDPGETDLALTLNGLQATWQSADGRQTWEGWLPHVDTRVSRALTQGSREHAVAFDQAGSLALRGQLDLYEMLQPAVQPGATLDYQRPLETVRLEFVAYGELAVGIDGRAAAVENLPGGLRRARIEIAAAGSKWHPFELKAQSPGTNLALTATWTTPEDPRPRALPVRRFLLPWARPLSDQSETAPLPAARPIPEISGGNWLRGRRLFFGDQLGCANCHTLEGLGGRIGPDLSNLIHRDYASVRKDIEFPNAALNPDHVASQLELSTGETLTALVMEERDGELRLAEANGSTRRIPRTQVRSQAPASLSLMPEGLWAALNATEQRDLMTFLLTRPLEAHPVAPVVQGNPVPAPRKLSEHPQLFATPVGKPGGVVAKASRVHIVLCASPKDAGHGAPGFHDYPLWRERWSKLLALDPDVEVETAERWPTPEQWARAQLVAFYHDNPAWVADKAGDLDAFLARGGGLVFLHWSMNAYRDLEPLKARLGRAWGPGGKFRYGLEDLTFLPHALTRGLPGAEGGASASLRITDEVYWNLPGDFAGVIPLATTPEEGQPQPQVWIKEVGPGRVFVCIPGHFTWTFDDPVYRVLLLRGLAWSARQPLDRWAELALVGARFEP